MAKDLIIGAFNNFEFEVLKPWIYSINESGFKGKKVLIAINSDAETHKRIAENGFEVVVIQDNSNMKIHMLRFIYIFNYIKDRPKEFNRVITTDVRDVIFQSDPSLYLNKLMQPLIASSECIRIEDEQWNKENIIKNFGPYFYDNVKNNDVLCVGIIAGQTRYVRDLCLILFQMSLNRPDWVADQAAYNILMGTYPYKEVTTTKFATLKDAWTVNAHVTNKPDQMEQFGPYLLEERPYFNVSTGKVVNSKGKPFVIVHQYDRVPEWNKYILDKYGVVIDEKTNIGTAPKYITIKT